ncbi:MAG: hypothetical protein AAF618_10215 [Pseudomonadota bacterium]
MRDRPPPAPLSFGLRLLIAAAFGLFGAILGVLVFIRDAGVQGFLEPGFFFPIYLFLISFLGTALVALAAAGLMGRPGKRGWGWALLGLALVTFLGSAIAGTLLFPGVGTITGPFLLLGTLTLSPLILIFWLLGGVGIHLLALSRR